MTLAARDGPGRLAPAPDPLSGSDADWPLRPRRFGAPAPTTADVPRGLQALAEALLALTVREWLMAPTWGEPEANARAHADAHRFLFAAAGPWRDARVTWCALGAGRWAAWAHRLAAARPPCRVCGQADLDGVMSPPARRGLPLPP